MFNAKLNYNQQSQYNINKITSSLNTTLIKLLVSTTLINEYKNHSNKDHHSLTWINHIKIYNLPPNPFRMLPSMPFASLAGASSKGRTISCAISWLPASEAMSSLHISSQRWAYTVTPEITSHHTGLGNVFSIKIPIPWKFHFDLIHILTIWLLHNYAYHKTDVQSHHVQDYTKI